MCCSQGPVAPAFHAEAGGTVSEKPPTCYRCGGVLRWSKPSMLRAGVQGPRDYDDPTEVTYHKACYLKALHHHAWCRKFLASDEAKRIGRSFDQTIAALGGQKEER